MAKDKSAETNERKSDRRGFLKKITFTTILLGFVGQMATMLRSLVPNVLYEPPLRLKIGPLEDFVDGVQFLEDKKLYLFKEGNQLYCITAVCTHLGCTVKYAAKQNLDPPWEFLCPCHGSKFKGHGENYSGPAPKPLQWYKLELAPEDGQLIVDFNLEVDNDFRLTV